MHSLSQTTTAESSSTLREAGPKRPVFGWLRPESVVLGLSLLAGAVIAFWSAPRGFDLLDSGCYFLEYEFPADVADTHTSYHLFARPLYLALGGSITGFRCVSWILVWAAALVFGWGWKRHMAAIEPESGRFLTMGKTLAIFVLASFATYAIKPAALTYNSINVIATYLALGLALDGTGRMIGKVDTLNRLALVEVGAAALVCTVDFFIKPPTALALLASIVAYCLVSPGLPRATKRRLAVFAAAAGVVGLLATVLMFGGVQPVWLRVQTVMKIAEDASFMSELYGRVPREFTELAGFLAHDLRWAALALVLAMGAAVAVRRDAGRVRVVAAVGAAVVAIAWLWQALAAGLWRGAHQYYADGLVARFYLGTTVLAAAAVLASEWVAPTRETRATVARSRWLKFLVWLILLVTPFAGAFGSTTSVFLNGALYAACWVGTAWMALIELAAIWSVGWPVRAMNLCLAGFAVAQLFNGQIAKPYMNPYPLWVQTIPTKVGPHGAELLLDEPTAGFIDDARQLLSEHGFKPGDDIFCFFNIPGLVYAVGGRSPVIPWYFGRIYVGNGVEEIYMQAAGPERRSRAWVVTQDEVTKYREHFRRGGLNFPDGYELIGSLVNPQSDLQVKFWKPRPAPR